MELKTAEKIALLKSRVADLDRAYKKAHIGKGIPIATKNMVNSVKTIFEEVKESLGYEETTVHN